MKKCISLFVIFLLIFSTVSNVAFAEYETEVIKIKGQEVLEGGQGVGFYDTSGNDTLETSGTSAVILREGEWTAHDISSLQTGYYKIYIMSASKAASEISVTISGKTYDASLPAGSETAYAKRYVGEGIISGEMSSLKLLNKSDSTLKCMRLELERTISQDYVFEAENVIEGGHDIGFHDNGERPNEIDKLEKAHLDGRSVVCLRKDEWTAYDISSLSKGTYIVSLTKSCKNDAYLNIYVDSYYEIKDATASSTTDYSIFTESILGVIHIEDGAEMLRVENPVMQALYIDSISLVKISDEHILTPEIKTFGKNVYSHIEGEGYHDEGGLTFTDSKMQTGNSVILHSKDWAAYNVSDVKSGVYDIIICVGTKAKTSFNVFVDGSKQLSSEVANTGGYGAFVEFRFGEVYLDGSDKLTIENFGSGSAYLGYFKLQKSNKTFANMYKHQIRANDVIPGGQGVGYYDNTDLTTNNGGGLEDNGGTVTLRALEWLKYDISSMIAGEYIIYAELSNSASGVLSASVDNSEHIIEADVMSTGGYGIAENVLIGTVDITDESKTLKIENTSTAAMMIRGITLELIPYYEDLKITKDASGTEEAKRLYGNNTLYVSGSFENVYYTTNGVRVISAFYDEEGRLLSASFDSIDTKIGEKSDVSIPIDVDSDAAKLKVLFWRNTDRGTPLLTEKTVYAGWDTHLYVDAQNGSDANSGTSKTQAFATINAAQQKVRAINDVMLGDVYVHLSGEFEIDETIKLTKEDSGTNGFNIIYQGEGKASVSGGRKISGFEAVEGTPLYKTKVENADFRQLFVNGNRAQRARSKWLYFAKDSYTDPDGQNYINTEIDGFILAKEDFKEDFAKPSDMEFVWMPSWKNIRMPVENMERNDDGDYVVTFVQPYFDAAVLSEETQPRPTVDIPFYIENAPEYLDEEGEWYYNKETKELFYYPLKTDNMESAEVYIPETEMLLSVNGRDEERVENITFRGIEFKYGAWNRTTDKGFSTTQAEIMVVPEKMEEGAASYPYDKVPAQVSVNYGKNINFEDNKFMHLGSAALSLDNKTEDSVIVGNVFDDISATAIMLSNADFVTNSPISDFVRNVSVTDNLIRRTSVEYMTPAVTAYYVHKTEISHNDIKDCPYSGISLGWGWGRGVKNCTDNKIANNRIENVLYKLKDGGHIYTLDIMKGTVFENNYLIKSGEWKGGIYLDNATSELVIRNNVFEECEKWLKLTWHNVKNNVAYGNYSETGAAVSYPEINQIAEATGKTDGVWPEEALNIINNAGLADSYKHLLTEYNENTHFRNTELKRMPYIAKAGVIVPAGELIPGGEGVAYHDIVSTVSGIGITDSYDGTGHKYIMSTSQGEWTKHSVDIPEDGTYKLILNAAATSNNPRVSIWIDDTLVVDKGRITNTGSYGLLGFVDNEMATVELTGGEHIIKVEHTVSNFGFYSLRFVNVNSGEFARNDGFVDELINVIKGTN